MRDKLLVYAIAASIGVHLILLCLVGSTSAAKPISVEQLKVVRVDLVKLPDQVKLQQDKPDEPKPKVEQPKLETPYVPPVTKMVTDKHPPKPEEHVRVKRPLPPPPTTPAYTPGSKPVRPSRTTMARVPGDPGGPLGGVAAPNGQDMGRVGSGSTPVGWVPGSDTGRGMGSGSGAGRGRPDPVPDAHPGPGLDPAPAPPQPKYVTVTVCAASGMRPGPYCDKKDSRSFREGSEPGGTCNVCKAPEVHHSTLADRSEPELIKDVSVKLPSIDESGDYIVRIRYTVNEDGTVSDVQIADSSGIPAIDRAVVEAASKMRYKPAVQNGEPRSVKIKRKYKIRL